MLEPLSSPEEWSGVVGLTRAMQEESGVPEELVVFGTDGSDSTFALWRPKGQAQRHDAPVIVLGEGGEGMAIAGTSLSRFLKGWTAYYLLLYDAEAEPLDALGLPENLRLRCRRTISMTRRSPPSSAGQTRSLRTRVRTHTSDR